MPKLEEISLERRAQSVLPSKGVLGSLRRNFALKMVSLALSILIYAYVVQERNPVVSHSFLADVLYRNLKPGTEVSNETPRVEVNVSGPKNSIDRMKDGDIKAIIDFKNIVMKDAPIKVSYYFEKPAAFNDVTLENPHEFLKIQVYRQISRKMEVKPIFKQDAPGGLRYGDPVVKPSIVEIKGRSDAVNRVDRIVAVATPSTPMGSIDGDFVLSARDGDNNSVENILISPLEAHVTVPQLDAPVKKFAVVSLVISDQPPAGYRFGNPKCTPNQVQIVGTPQQLANRDNIETEDIFVRNLTTDAVQEVNLIIPPDILVQDKNGKPVSKVRVTIPIIKVSAQPPVGNGIQP